MARGFQPQCQAFRWRYLRFAALGRTARFRCRISVTDVVMQALEVPVSIKDAAKEQFPEAFETGASHRAAASTFRRMFPKSLAKLCVGSRSGGLLGRRPQFVNLAFPLH